MLLEKIIIILFDLLSSLTLILGVVLTLPLITFLYVLYNFFYVFFVQF